MSHLTRTSAAGLQLEDALTLEEIAEKVEAVQLDFLHPLEIGTGDLVKVFLTQEEATEVRFGRFIELDQSDKELAAFEGDKLLAILEKGTISTNQERFLASHCCLFNFSL